MSTRLIFFLVSLVLALAFGCSSDPDTPLGSEFVTGGLIDTDPGETFQDTLRITSGDVSFVTNATITSATTMNIGRKNNIESTMMVRFDFSNPGNDTLPTVDSALVTLIMPDTTSGTLNAQFFEFLSPFEEGDTISSLDISTTPLPDGSGVNTNRVMRFFPRTYSLPPALVQDWVRGNQEHFGIAIKLDDPTTTEELEFVTRTGGDFPFLKIFLSDNSQPAYRVSDDGTFVTDLNPPTTDLRLSDGPTRRIFVPVDLSAFDSDALLHNARLVFRIVPGSRTGGDNTVQLYAPESDIVGDPGILTGELIIIRIIPTEVVSEYLVLPVRQKIQDFIDDPTENHGFVLRYSLEGNEIRSVLFYGSANVDSLQPFLDLTFSEPATFPGNE